MMREFWDERGYTVTEQELLETYTGLVQSGEIDSTIKFSDYILACTGENGTLQEIKK